MEENFYDLATKIRQRNKDITSTNKEDVGGSFNLKTTKIIPCTLYFILIYFSFLGICKEFSTREHTKQPYRI